MLTARYKNVLKNTVNTRRYNKEVKRQKLAKLRLQFFVSIPRLNKVTS